MWASHPCLAFNWRHFRDQSATHNQCCSRLHIVSFRLHFLIQLAWLMDDSTLRGLRPLAKT